MTVLSQEIVERLVSQFLEGLPAFGSEQPELLPGLLVKLDAFANHGVGLGHDRCTDYAAQPASG